MVGLSTLAVGCLVVAACGGAQPRRSVIVPRLAGLSSQLAVHRLCALGLRPDAVKVASSPPIGPAASPRRVGLVAVPVWIVGSDPAAGTSVQVGSTVTLRFGAPANVALAIRTRC